MTPRFSSSTKKVSRRYPGPKSSMIELYDRTSIFLFGLLAVNEVYLLSWIKLNLRGLRQSASVWHEQSSGCVDVTSSAGSKRRLHAIVWSCASDALDPAVMNRNVRISKPTLCPNSVWTTFNLYIDGNDMLSCKYYHACVILYDS